MHRFLSSRRGWWRKQRRHHERRNKAWRLNSGGTRLRQVLSSRPTRVPATCWRMAETRTRQLCINADSSGAWKRCGRNLACLAHMFLAPWHREEGESKNGFIIRNWPLSAGRSRLFAFTGVVVSGFVCFVVVLALNWAPSCTLKKKKTENRNPSRTFFWTSLFWFLYNFSLLFIVVCLFPYLVFV